MNEGRERQEGSGATVSQLRRRIDRGETDDKVDAHDPSAAPLGTDDEAAGQPPGPEQVDRAMAQQPQSSGQSARPSQHRRPVAGLWFLVAAAAILGLILLAG